jgi:glycosyltransferase involved in cell wall biosynthesis
VNACTIIARNYLAHARILARSFLEYHPGGRFTALVIDGDESTRAAGGDEFEVRLPHEIGIAADEFRRMAMIYDVMELATAVKPWLLETLLTRGAESVTYFDPDIEVFRPLDDIADLAREHSIVLTPHTLAPLHHTDEDLGEVTLLLAGMFNLGFIGVGHGAGQFLAWWQERLARSGYVAPERGQFVDQRWVDFVPSLFDHAILRDPACNVAHWNLETRRFEQVGDEYRVDGRPLRFFHYSGFDPERPYLLSKFLGPQPRILLSENPALAHICAQYAEKLLAMGYREAKTQPYGFGTLPNGVAITQRMRRLYGAALRAAEEEDGDEPPAPFDSPNEFVAWLNEPVHPAAPEFTRYLTDLFSRRPALQREFPDPRWIDGERFRDWVATTGRETEGIPAALVPPPRPPKTEPTPLVPGGVNVAGYFRAEAGVGQAARHLIRGLDRARIPHSTFTYGETLSRQHHSFEDRAGATYDINVICVNADQVPRFTYDVGPDFFEGRHSIGVWWWEVGTFPAQFHQAFAPVNEVWVGSDFVREAIAAETEKPVLTMPLGIELPEAAPVKRSAVLPQQGFVFLFSFDFDSRFERKNPIAVVEAFRRAFPPSSGPTLVLKSINGDRWLTQLEELRAAVAGRSDIRVIDGYLSAEENASLMATCDCYVSLHRSEGFGLTIAEAMAYGKPVIATAYSGNLMFMTEETSYLVPYELTPIPEGAEPYPVGGLWADPDVDSAAELMRHVFEQPAEAEERGRRAREHVADKLSPGRMGAFLRDRMGGASRFGPFGRLARRGLNVFRSALGSGSET